VPIIDANPRPDVAGRFPDAEEPAQAEATPERATPAPREPLPPATVDLRGDELADPVRHDDDPPVPTGPVIAGEPGRP
jgi:hypothetical protein